ncbi:hypothetical protein AB0L70_04465 [Kribbella sp. NPDC051952]|uniref:hypothetical protein n=1 Tax=Kribbella sp. NPDC051952 TaxID=3154851 RepID=UPI00343806F1
MSNGQVSNGEVGNSTPEIPGYELDQRLLQHPLAELWHGRTFTGMEIIALVLSDAGARDATVRDRLVAASRDAALEPGQLETPLWAANFNSGRPYAITQLIPGQSGAERLLDPLDGILGNDEASVQAIRAQLSQYGAVPPSAAQPPPEPQAQQTQAETDPQSKIEVAREYRRKIGAGIYVVAVVIVLIVFTVTYSIGTAIGGVVKDEPTEAAPAAAVSPGALPSPVLLPAIQKVSTAPYKRPDGSAGVFGATYAAGTDLQVITNAELPFALGWPRPPQVFFLGESSSVIYRRILTHSNSSDNGLRNSIDARIALHPCATLAACVADRTAFDQQWTKTFKAPAPGIAKDSRTWLTVNPAPYAVSMTRAFQSGGQWWLVGTVVTTLTQGEEPDVQRIVNDIWRQTT